MHWSVSGSALFGGDKRFAWIPRKLVWNATAAAAASSAGTNMRLHCNSKAVVELFSPAQSLWAASRGNALHCPWQLSSTAEEQSCPPALQPATSRLPTSTAEVNNCPTWWARAEWDMLASALAFALGWSGLDWTPCSSPADCCRFGGPER